MYKPKYFSAQELLPKNLYNKYKHRGDDWILNVVFDERILRVADKIREIWGPITVNTWHYNSGRKFQWRGFRDSSCRIGAKLSQHRFGRGLDLIPRNFHPTEIRHAIIQGGVSYSYVDEFEFIGGLEMDINWLHVDVRPRNKSGEINLFYP